MAQDLSQVYKALQNADAAGDVEGAKQLADYIRSQQAAPSPTQTTAPKDESITAGDVVKGAARGVVGAAYGAVADPILGLAKLAGAQTIPNAIEEGYQSLRKDLGGEGADVSRALGTVGSLFFPGVGAAGAASKLGKAGQFIREAQTPISWAAKSKFAAPVAEKASKLIPSFAPNVTRGALTGVEQSLIAPDYNPEHQDNYLANKLDPAQLGTAAVLGGGFNKLATALTPKAGSLGETLVERNMGTLGQQSQSPLIQKLERGVSKYVPFTGGIIEKKQQKAISKVKAELDAGYDNLYKGLDVKATDDTEKLINNIKTRADELGETGNPTALENANTLRKVSDYIKKNVGTIHDTKEVPIKATIQEASPFPVVKGTEDIAGEASRIIDIPQPKVQNREVGAMLKWIKDQKELAYKSGNHDLGKELKSIIADTKDAIGKQAPEGFVKKLNSLDSKYKQFSDLRKALPRQDATFRNIIGLGELGATAVRGSSFLSPLTWAGILGSPLFLSHPGIIRATAKTLKEKAIPLTSGERYTSGEYDPDFTPKQKQGGLAHYDSGGVVEGTPLAKKYPGLATEEPGLEAPLFSPDDLLGPGAIKGLGALAAKGLTSKGALAGLAGTIGRNIPEDLWAVPKQLYDSAATSINDKKLPSAFTKLLNKNEFKPNTVNIDIGGGRFDNATEALAEANVKNHVFDPFNRSYEHNMDVVNQIANGKADTATINNVLNVIAERDNQLKVLHQAKNALKPKGKAYISVYEGNKTGVGKPTSKGFQHNKSTKEYLDLVKEVFPNTELRNGIITTTKRKGGLV